MPTAEKLELKSFSSFSRSEMERCFTWESRRSMSSDGAQPTLLETPIGTQTATMGKVRARRREGQNADWTGIRAGAYDEGDGALSRQCAHSPQAQDAALRTAT